MTIFNTLADIKSGDCAEEKKLPRKSTAKQRKAFYAHTIMQQKLLGLSFAEILETADELGPSVAWSENGNLVALHSNEFNQRFANDFSQQDESFNIHARLNHQDTDLGTKLKVFTVLDQGIKVIHQINRTKAGFSLEKFEDDILEAFREFNVDVEPLQSKLKRKPPSQWQEKKSILVTLTTCFRVLSNYSKRTILYLYGCPKKLLIPQHTVS